MVTEGFDDALGASYRLVERRGTGATGEVWEAVDRRTDETVAAKLLRSEHAADQELVGRFVRERSILTGVRHGNVVTVRDLVVEGDRLAIVMDYVGGGSLRDVVAEGPLPPRTAVLVGAAVLDGLAAAHRSQVLHRDIKPDNVLLAPGWEDLHDGAVRLTDFGISRMLAEGRGTTTGLLGTPEYMAPELIATGACDLSADVYGVGVLLYELLAGRTPFAGPGTDYTVAHRHVTSDPPVLEVPEPLWSAIAAMLAKDPDRRPTAAEAAGLLRRLVDDLDGLPALPTQQSPDSFDSARGPATVLRGVTPPEDGAGAGPVEDPTGPVPPPDLGTPDHQTTIRPMPVRSPAAGPRDDAPTPRTRRRTRPRWLDPRAIGFVVAALVLLGAAVAYATTGGGPEPDAPPPDAAPARATQQDRPTRAGLTISRTAAWDPETGTATITITYAAQNAPLTGPFLEVLPGVGDACPTVTWEGTTPETNLPSVTKVDVDCGWSVDPGTVPAQGTATVTARLPLDLDPADAGTATQEWLDAAAGTTSTTVTDPGISTTAYPVQRLQDVRLVAPSRTVSRKTLHLTLLPVWPDGPDQLHPLYTSPSVGDPSSLLTAVAGGEEGLRFSDGCSGALAVSNDGLVVTARNVAAQCTVIARVGNIDDVTSNGFDIVTRGG